MNAGKALSVRLAEGQPVVPDVGAAKLPARFRGQPLLDAARCREGCSACVDACPTGAISVHPLTLDLGACLFCPVCTETCPEGAIAFTTEYRMAATRRESLLFREGSSVSPEACSAAIRRQFGRSLKLRSVSAAGCNGCELELNALGNVNFDMGRFGIEFVASPRHADGVVISGPISQNMAYALEATYQAMPQPKLLILFGACAISGGPFHGSAHLARGFLEQHHVDLYFPGCPPHPLTFIHGLLRYLGQIRPSGRNSQPD